MRAPRLRGRSKTDTLTGNGQGVFAFRRTKGLSVGAAALGGPHGAAELIFEKFSVDELLSVKNVTGARSLLKEGFKHAGVNMGEETLTEVANIMSDAAIMGEKSRFNQLVRYYKTEEHMSGEDAKRQAYLDMIGDVTLAGIGGFLAGKVTGSLFSAAQYRPGPGGGEVIAQNQQTPTTDNSVKKMIKSFDNDHLAQNKDDLLKNYKAATIPDQKLSGYALNMEHPSGRHKAIAFPKALGYTVDNRDLLIAQVYRGLKKYRAIGRNPNQYGEPFEVSMIIAGVNGRYAKVKTAWIIDYGATAPRLVSIYIDE